MTDIGIIIVTYNSEAEIGACLDAALPSGAEIVVVDNASRTRQLRRCARRGVRLIANPDESRLRRRRQSGLCGIELHLCAAAESRRGASEQPGAAARGAATCRARRAPGDGWWMPGGNPQIGFMVRSLPTPASLTLEALLLNRIWPNNPVNRRVPVFGAGCWLAWQLVEQPAGAFLMIRRAGLAGAWADSMKSSFRSGSKMWISAGEFGIGGYRLYYMPEAVAKHTGGHSIPSLTVEMRRVYWYRSLLRYSAKHFRPVAFRVVCLAVVTGSFLRGIAEAVGASEPQAHGSVWESRAARRPMSDVWLFGSFRDT